MLKLKETDHSYHCSTSNLYVNGINNYGLCEYDDWEGFKEKWLFRNGKIDDDYNHCFRFDILEKVDEETGDPIGGYELRLFFMLQRKGNFVPVQIHTVTENNLQEINEFLEDRWKYLKNQWIEFSGDVK